MAPEHRDPVGKAVAGDPLASVNESLRRLFGSRPRREYRLGVLFVHGIGEQQRGDTLTEMGDALVAWLKRILERGAPRIGDVRLFGGALRQADDDEIATAHLKLRITVDPQGTPVHSDWLLAESWWADVFRGPTFGEFVGWGITVGPWVAVTQFLSISQRLCLPPRLPWVVAILVWVAAILTLALLVLASLALALFLFLLAAVLTVLRLVPVGFVQAAAVALQRPLLGGFGDAFILVRSPGRFAAMAARVRADVGALLKVCDEVVVVAHSQGTQVAWSALRHPRRDSDLVPRRVVRFVTFGQALAKLKFLYLMTHQQMSIGRLAGLGMSLVAQLALLAVAGELVHRLLNDGAALFDGWFIITAAVAFVVAESITLMLGRSRWASAVDDLAREIETAVVDRPGWWDDYWASADPFPNGPLLPAATDRVASWRIRNLGSVFLDHTAYWRNLSEFVTAVGRDLGARAFPGHAPFDDTDAPRRHARAAMRRAARVQVRVALFVAWFLTALAFIPVAIDRLAPTVQEVLAEPVEAASTWFLVGPLVSWAEPVLPYLVCALLVLVVAFVAWSFLIGPSWTVGSQADDRAYFGGRDVGLFPRASLLAPIVLLVILVAGPILLWLVAPDPIWYALPLMSAPAILVAWTLLSTAGRRIGQPSAGPEPGVLSGTAPRLTILVAATTGLLLWTRLGDADIRLIAASAYAVVVAALLYTAVAVFRRFWAEFDRL